MSALYDSGLFDSDDMAEAFSNGLTQPDRR